LRPFAPRLERIGVDQGFIAGSIPSLILEAIHQQHNPQQQVPAVDERSQALPPMIALGIRSLCVHLRLSAVPFGFSG
jgi:hypothetical protein